MNVPRREGAVAALLAFIAGFVDTAGFIALFGLFTAHVTGNFVLIGAALTQGGAGVLAKLLALPTFVLAVAGARVFALRRERSGRDAAFALLIAQAVLLTLFLGLGLAAVPLTDADEPVGIAAGMAGVTAMGVQNAASRTVFGSLSPTTVMTGNVTQIVIDLVDVVAGRNLPEVRARLAKLWPPVATFAFGAVAGAAGFALAGFWCLTVAIAAVLLVLAVRRRAPA